ncbi:MAG: tetratricopeptide repeat protein [Planctomycetia bacterium]
MSPAVEPSIRLLPTLLRGAAWRRGLRAAVAALLALLAGLPGLWADEAAPAPAPAAAPAAPRAVPSDAGRLSAEDVRALLADLRAGIAVQDRLARALPAEAVERIFTQLLASNPGHAGLRFLRARALRTAAGAAEMRVLAGERLGLAPSERQQVGAAWFAVARREAELGQLDPALQAAGFALRLDPGDEAYALLGWIYVRKGDAERAIQAYEGALKIEPRQVGARLALTDLLLRRGRVPDALRIAKDTLLLAPRVGLAQLYWGTALALSGSPDEARRAYQRALRLAGQDPDQVAAVAAALKRIDGQRLALDTLRRTHAVHRTHREVALQLASLLLEVGRAEEARQVVTSALEAHEDDARLWFLRGLCDDGMGDPRAAGVAYQRAIKADPDRSDYRLALAASLRRLGDPKQALLVYRQAAQRFPKDRRARELYARALVEDRQYTEAAVELEEVTRLAPEDPDPCYLLAVVRGLNLGQLREARSWMERYAALGGKEGAALDWLSQLRRENR